MTQLSDPQELLGSIDRMPYSIWQPLGAGMSPAEAPRTSAAGSDAPRADEQESMETVWNHIRNLLMSDTDDRLDYLQQASPALTEDHLNQIVTATDSWLNDEARDRLRALVQQRFDDCDSPADILKVWLTSQEIQRLVELLDQSEVPDHTLALCYTLCEALGVVHAAYFVYEGRARRKTDFTSVNQTPEDIAADLRFVNA